MESLFNLISFLIAIYLELSKLVALANFIRPFTTH